MACELLGDGLNEYGSAWPPVLPAPEPGLAEAVAQGVDHDRPGVGDALDVADLVAVEGRRRDLGDALPGPDELQDDLGVEVEAVAVGRQRQVAQHVDPVGPVARVPLAELDAGELVLGRGQDLVADELVERHVAPQGRTPLEHARAEHGVGLALEERLDHLADALGGVLPVAVQQHDHVPPVVDGVLVARLLVSAVPEVAGVTDDRDGDVVEGVVGAGDGFGVVAREVVLDQDLGELATRLGRDPVEDPAQGRFCVVRDDEHADLHRTPAPTSPA